ncbi:MAG: hypothetical protein FWC50_02040 [Planctomycetaceae bacterium]|nr:hypothetical protein [Planctomycetaceae bacterium]
MIRRKKPRDTGISEAGNDSFLDIVSNMVGILIILVVIAGLRARNNPEISKADEAKIQDASETHAQKIETFHKAYSECFALSRQFETMQAQYNAREAEQNGLVGYYARLETGIRSHTAAFDEHSKQHWELQRQIFEADAKLGELEQKKKWLSDVQKPDAVILENMPTPIGTSTGEKEVHFRMLNGRIVFVPLAPMLEQLKLEVVRRRDELLKLPRITGTLGPFENFRMQYSVVRKDIPFQRDAETGERSMIMLESCQMIPDVNATGDNSLGEPVAEAIRQPASQFRRRLAATRQNENAITVWVYPDSFGDFQTVKNFLYQSGYRAAARPLDFGVPISASPQGTKSSAQ